MKDLVEIRGGKWVWPKNDENRWKHQTEYNKLADHLLSYQQKYNDSSWR